MHIRVLHKAVYDTSGLYLKQKAVERKIRDHVRGRKALSSSLPFSLEPTAYYYSSVNIFVSEWKSKKMGKKTPKFAVIGRVKHTGRFLKGRSKRNANKQSTRLIFSKLSIFLENFLFFLFFYFLETFYFFHFFSSPPTPQVPDGRDCGSPLGSVFAFPRVFNRVGGGDGDVR